MLTTLKRWLGLLNSPPPAAPNPPPAPAPVDAEAPPREAVDARQLRDLIAKVWAEQIEARWNDDYDREVGAMATSRASRIFMDRVGEGDATYRRVSKALLAVMDSLEDLRSADGEYSDGTSAVGSALYWVLSLLRRTRPEWLDRPDGAPAHVEAWLDRKLEITAEACIRAGRDDEERVGYLLRALGDWRSDCAAWQSLRGRFTLHDGVFDGARASFEGVATHLQRTLESATSSINTQALVAELQSLRQRAARASDIDRTAVDCACDFAQTVLAVCATSITPETALRRARQASTWRLIRASRSAR